MKITSLHLRNFRNYNEVDIFPGERVNLITGKNGSGKTNILEAIYYFCFSKSPRKALDSHLIKFDTDGFLIEEELQSGDLEYKLRCSYSKKSKDFTINGVKLEKKAKLIGMFPCVYMSPEDNDLARLTPSARRRYMDVTLSQIDSVYLKNLIKYKKIVESRNKMLKIRDKNFSIYDKYLIDTGAYLINCRKWLLGEINKHIGSLNYNISNQKDSLEVLYSPSIKDNNGDLLIDYANCLSESCESDLNYGTTGNGPHRDDFKVIMNGKPISDFGSQGQIRTSSIALKLSEWKIIRDETKISPILLLDDVFSELDAGRLKRLRGIVSDMGQVFITSPYELFENTGTGDKILIVENNQVRDKN